MTRAHIHTGVLPSKHDARLDLAQEVRLNLAADVLHRFGEVRFIAHGTSMIPSIYPGDLLTIRSESMADARCGEIVLFLLSGRFFVHRVMRKWPEGTRIVFATRGDALTQEDPSVDGSQLLGRVTSILRLGKPVKSATRLNPWMSSDVGECETRISLQKHFWLRTCCARGFFAVRAIPPRLPASSFRSAHNGHSDSHRPRIASSFAALTTVRDRRNRRHPHSPATQRSEVL